MRHITRARPFPRPGAQSGVSLRYAYQPLDKRSRLLGYAGTLRRLPRLTHKPQLVLVFASREYRASRISRVL